MNNTFLYVTVLLFFCGTGLSQERQVAKGGAATFEKRRQSFIDRTLNEGSSSCYTELVRLKMGVKPDEDKIRNNGLGILKDRRDTADFRLPAILNILHKYSDSGLLSESLVAEAKDTILNFKYWPDELEGWNWKKTPEMDSAYIYIQIAA